MTARTPSATLIDLASDLEALAEHIDSPSVDRPASLRQLAATARRLSATAGDAEAAISDLGLQLPCMSELAHELVDELAPGCGDGHVDVDHLARVLVQLLAEIRSAERAHAVLVPEPAPLEVPPAT